MRMPTDMDDIATLMHLVQMCDSAFPVGGFSFSNGLESAVHIGLVHDAVTLEAYTGTVARNALYSDGVAALTAHRACLRDDFDAVVDADRRAMLCRMNAEARQQSVRMGCKMAEMSQRIAPSPMVERWLSEVQTGHSYGTFPVAQALAFASAGIGERLLVGAQYYGSVSVILNASLRCLRVTHYDTQRTLFRLLSEVDDLYGEIASLGLDDMQSFVPECDVIASLHEKGSQRMFMS